MDLLEAWARVPWGASVKGSKRIVEAYEPLEPMDLRVLRVIEVGLRRFEYVPLEVIVKWCSYPETLVSRSLRKLNKLELVVRSRGSYVGYKLTALGYDVLALHTLAKRGVVSAMSATPLGIGKEADVYAADTPTGEKVVIKFHRVGRTSFRQTRRFRSWVGNRRHITWLYESRLSAHMEFKALSLTHGAGVKVPRPIAVNRHAVVMQYIEGLTLAEVDGLGDPGETLLRIIEEVRRAYALAGVVHGDLSEFNIMVSEGEVYIIDWPQWVPRGYVNAKDLLTRDLDNVLRHFERRYGVTIDLVEALSYVTSGVEEGGLGLEEAYVELIGEEGLGELIKEVEEDLDEE